MATPATYRVFLSAVTRELGTFRAEVARVLRRKGLEVREQEHFNQGSATLLEHLRAYIEHCDAVILLIGERCGAFPTDEHAAALGTVPAFEKYRTATGQTRASYTQWELFLAKQYGKKTYVFLSDAGFSPDEPNAEGADLQACQAAYRRWIDASGEHRDPLTIKTKVVEDVLVLPFPDLLAAKPINLPFASLNELFQGREEVLETLRKKLTEKKAGQAMAIAGKAIHGLGGVGKSRLAIEYAWRYAGEYSAVLFVGAGSPADLRRNLAALTKVLDLPEREATDEEIQGEAVLRRLAEQSGWLLILDNVDTKEAAVAVDALVARLHGGDVLLTGRLARWGAEVEPIELDVLAEEAAVAFLLARTKGRRRTTKDDAVQAKALAREVGCLPLALEQAGAYISERKQTFEGYLKEWYSRHEQVLAWFDSQVSHYPASIAVTWQTSVDRLTAPARRLLERLAWLGPEPIPESLLDVPIPDLLEPEAAETLHDALVDLVTYSLVTRADESPTFSVHRLVQDVTRRSVREAPGDQSLNEALRWVDAAFVGNSQDERTWPTLDPLSPHARVVVAFADSAGIAEPTARLMDQLGRLFLNKASLTEAEPLMCRALAIDEVSFGAEHPNVARDLNNLAQLLQATNRLAEAEPLMRRALAIDEASFGADHPEVATDLNNLAQLLRATNRLTEAEPLMRRVVAILGEHHPNSAGALSNLAQLLKATNRLTEAEPLMRRALAIDEARFGAEHPEVAIALNNLALLLEATNRTAEAEPLMCRALAIVLDFERQTEFEHPRRQLFSKNYRTMLRAMFKSDAEIEAAFAALGIAPSP
jgi:tetratricopeptide (TPR) repeat protein